METLTNFLLGPFYDLKRFAAGAVSKPPATRIVSEEGLLAARAVLSEANCALQGCTKENLHTWTTSLPPDQLFDLLAGWRLWPRSAFFACPSTDESGAAWFAYRWYNVMPIVVMKLKSAVKPRHIIYDIEWGIGAGGYHAFLINPAEPAAGDSSARPVTTVSIFTAFPPTRLFLEGLHDQVNYDISQKLRRLQTSGELSE